MSASYSGDCVRNEFGGEVDLNSLGVTVDTISNLVKWNSKYKQIMPMTREQRVEHHKLIKLLDSEGIELSYTLEAELSDSSKIKYYSEGLLQFVHR